MKLLVFAHVPPPHHGQSYMVQQMLAGFGGDQRRRGWRSRSELAAHAQAAVPAHGIACYHVNARFSRKLEDIGDIHPAKLLLLLRYCAEAIWLRFRHGVTHFYYVPGPGKRSALYRDWLVMLLCRPFFRKVIFHWHAAGLAKWLETAVQIRTRSLTYRFMKHADLSVVLSQFNRRDAEKILPKQIKVVGNGIPDPCPAFERDVLPRRRARFAARAKLLSGQALSEADLKDTGGDPAIFKVLFLANCTREKGMFDTLDGVELANQQLARARSPIRIKLTVGGAFIHAREEAEFETRLRSVGVPPDEGAARPRDNSRQVAPAGLGESWVSCAGFLSGDAKYRAFAGSDCFCFPTYYYAESFGLVLIEAMAFGLSIVASRWRSIPEIMPAGWPGLVQPRNPPEIANALLAVMGCDSAQMMRDHFLHRFTAERYLTELADAFHSLE